MYFHVLYGVPEEHAKVQEETIMDILKKEFARTDGNFFLHPIHCDWHSMNILKFNCTLVMFILKRHVGCVDALIPSRNNGGPSRSWLHLCSFHSTLRCRKNVNQDARMRTLVREMVLGARRAETNLNV